MELIIHGGTHKTATTSFQKFCFNKSKLLNKNRICYPLTSFTKFSKTHDHNDIAEFALINSEEDLYKKINFEVMPQICKSKILLLSGESFENIIIDQFLFKKIENVFYKLKFKKISWVFVYRDKNSYLESIYKEVSGERALLNFKYILMNVKKYGYLQLQTNINNYYFAIDFERCIENFKKRNPKINLKIFTFTEFKNNKLGYCFFEYFKIEGIQELYEDYKKIKFNPSRSFYEVEFNYIRNFFLLPINKNFKIPITTFYKIILFPLIILRIVLFILFKNKI